MLTAGFVDYRRRARMEGQGPRNGAAYEAGVVLAGANPFAVDAAMGRLMGFAGGRLPVELEAVRRGLVNLEALELVGDGRDLAFGFVPPHTYENLEEVVPSWLAAATKGKKRRRSVEH